MAMSDLSSQPPEWGRLLSQLHHRLRNNLQMIMSVISLQASRTSDPNIAAAVRATQNRVRAIAGILGGNTTPDLTTVHFGNYLEYLVQELAAEYAVSDRVEMKVRAADLALGMNDAIPLALIANELTANALEHAFPGEARGNICVTLSYTPVPVGGVAAMEHAELEISDTGVPLPDAWELQTADSTGFYLVRTLTSQLRGKIMVETRQSGKAFRLAFPLATEESPE
jgi:two-component sensor histidine kinase